MKHLLAGLLVLGASALQAQTADEIIQSHITALGGKEKLLSIQSIYMEGTSVLQNGSEITQKIWKQQGKGMRQEIESAMFNMATVVTDKEGWRKNPRNSGQFEPMPAEAVAAMQSELDCAGPLVDYAAKGHQVTLLGKEDVEGVSCWKLKLTLKQGRDITYFVDAATWLVQRTVTTGGGGFGGGRGPAGGAPRELVTDYGDYRKNAQGYLFPYKTTIVGMGGGLFYEIIEINPKMEPQKIFKPADL
ncbi:MAG TPA: hypothetical protein PKE07_11640 [Lacibacter sp.]|nr:hypothetical protein [Lacibacter sp.]HMO88853.1 hypothetical protein [Lacibacter sp.]